MTHTEMTQALTRAIQDLYPDKQIHTDDQKLLGSHEWHLTVDGIGYLKGQYATDILRQVRAALDLDERPVELLVQDIMEAAKKVVAQERLISPNSPSQPIALQAAAAPAPIDYDKLSDLVVQKLAARK